MTDETDTTTSQIETTTEAPAAVDAAAVAAPVDTADEATILGGAPEAGGSDPKEGSDGEEAAAGPPEAYELSAPEGVVIDPAAVELATPVFKELGLSNEQANKLVPVAAEWAKSLQEKGQQTIMADVMAQRKAWVDEVHRDTELFADQVGVDEEGHPLFQINPDKQRLTLALTAKALDTLGYPKGSPFRSFLTDSGLGNHPEMIRAFRKIGQAVGEDNDFVRGDVGAQVKVPREAILYPDDVRKEGA